MTETVENEEAYVGGEENVVWGLLDGVLLERFRIIMLGDATICFICTVTKLRVNGGEELLSGRLKWVYETVVLIVLIEEGVLGGSCGGGRERNGGRWCNEGVLVTASASICFMNSRKILGRCCRHRQQLAERFFLLND